jgi:hypothetical protein
MSATSTMGARRPSVNRSTTKGGKPAESWWVQTKYQRRKRGSGYVVRVGRKLGQLSFCFHESKPLPDEQQAHAWGEELLAALKAGRPARSIVWWSWRVVERRVGMPGVTGRSVWVGTVRKWLGASSFVWREIAPCDSQQEAERIAKQTVVAGQWLEGFPLRTPREVQP